MCGIVGYIGRKQAAPIIIEGLRRLEYRGYDSAGITTLNRGNFEVRKKKGKIDEGLAWMMSGHPVEGCVGIGHTRWATHGPPSDENSHPHLDQSGRIAVVHNGVIENFQQLREELSGHDLKSSTDTEVLAHWIGLHYDRLRDQEFAGDDVHLLTRAVMNALREVIGTYGIAVISTEHPDLMVGARRGSPLIVGVGNGENFLASDANAIASHTRQVVYLSDQDVVTLTPDQFNLVRLDSNPAEFQISQLEFHSEDAERGEFAHYMLKEIFEQPRTVQNTMRGRIAHEDATARFGGLNMTTAELRAIERVVMPACGTSWHSALIGEFLFEELAHLPAEVEYASEFRYRNAPIEKHTLVLAITQSGETADTLAGLREAKRRGHKVLAICNVVGSTIAREADGGIYLHAGPEIGVASTKSFTSQVTALALLALHMGRIRMLPFQRGMEIIRALEAIPAKMDQILAQDDAIKQIALKYADAEDFFFLGRQYNFPVALEGALKLKEISYIHAEGYPAAEMKHGPIAMIDERTPTVVVIPNDVLYEKTFSNLEEIKARKGPIIALATEGNERIGERVDDVICLPQTLDLLSPLLAALPLQLLAYHVAVARGCDVDKPRNLAKSVTVE